MNDTHGETGKGWYGFDLDGTLAKEEAMTKKEDQAMSDRTECPFAEHRTNPLGQERVYCRCPGAKPTPMATADFCEFGLLPCSRYEDYMTGRAQQNADAAAAVDDTHGVEGKGWYGFDLDGTLAKYDGWRGIIHIGKPIAPMVKLIQQMHDEGKVVKIMTARVAPKAELETGENPYLKNHWCIQEPDVQTWALKKSWGPLEFVQEWCYRHLGFIPEIVYQKDHLMLELYDDRVKQVIPNLGYLVEDIAASKRVVREVASIEVVNCKWVDRLASFCLGLLVTAILYGAAVTWCAKSVPESIRNLDRAVQQYHKSYLKEMVW